MVFKDGAAVADRGFFAGYSPMVWLCISLNSLGGLAVAMVVKYADNVVRFFTLSYIFIDCSELHRASNFFSFSLGK